MAGIVNNDASNRTQSDFNKYSNAIAVSATCNVLIYYLRLPDNGVLNDVNDTVATSNVLIHDICFCCFAQMVECAIVFKIPTHTQVRTFTFTFTGKITKSKACSRAGKH